MQMSAPTNTVQVVSDFGGDEDGEVSLPKFLRFLGKEYGRGVRVTGGDAGPEVGKSRSLAGRLRLILKKVRLASSSLVAFV